MATTTNYGWTTPDDTALVKDGASAIRTLGSSIDTSLNNALGTKKAGLVLLNTTSFSAVASQSINDVFSATYTNYKAIVNITAFSSDVDTFKMRLRVSGADDTGSIYRYNMTQRYNGGFDQLTSTGTTDWVIHRYTRTVGYYGEFDFFNPFASNVTGLYTTGANPNRDVTEGSFTYASTNTTTSFTGFTFYPSAGTQTGTISIYGVNK